MQQPGPEMPLAAAGNPGGGHSGLPPAAAGNPGGGHSEPVPAPMEQHYPGEEYGSEMAGTLVEGGGEYVMEH